jgi:hypothetical protein
MTKRQPQNTPAQEAPSSAVAVVTMETICVMMMVNDDAMPPLC